MLSVVKKRKKIDKFIYQELRNVVREGIEDKEGGDKVLENFEQKFKETQIEGCKKDATSTSVMYTKDDDLDDLP